jgi:nitrate reductase NapA
VKGYHSVMALYASDRITKAQIRKNGKLVPVPLDEALDLVANKMKETIAAHGKDSVAMYGSGQWTIPDGYVASKFMKGGIGTNNLEANARLCMASAVTGFMTTFGIDEPMGCYDDIDHADVFVLWGNNMARCIRCCSRECSSSGKSGRR